MPKVHLFAEQSAGYIPHKADPASLKAYRTKFIH